MALAGMCGSLYAGLARRERAIIRANLELVFGPPASSVERRRLVRAICTHAARVLLDFFWFAKETRQRVLDHVELDGGVSALCRSSAPAIVVTGHMGCWELAAQILCAHGRKLTSVFAPIGGPTTQALMERMRSSDGHTVVPREGAVVGLLRALRQGHLVGLLLDQRTPLREGGLFVDFMGRKTTMSKVAGTLSVRLRVPVAVMWCRYAGNGRYRAEFLGELPADHGLDEAGVTQWVSDALGRAIRANPGQWLWMYRRWRHVPAGEDPSAYPFYAGPHDPAMD